MHEGSNFCTSLLVIFHFFDISHLKVVKCMSFLNYFLSLASRTPLSCFYLQLANILWALWAQHFSKNFTYRVSYNLDNSLVRFNNLLRITQRLDGKASILALPPAPGIQLFMTTWHRRYFPDMLQCPCLLLGPAPKRWLQACSSLSILLGSSHPSTGLNHSLHTDDCPQQSTASPSSWPVSPHAQLLNGHVDFSGVLPTRRSNTELMLPWNPFFSCFLHLSEWHHYPSNSQRWKAGSVPSLPSNHNRIWLGFPLEISPVCLWPQIPAASAPIQASTIPSWLFVAGPIACLRPAFFPTATTGLLLTCDSNHVTPDSFLNFLFWNKFIFIE